MPLYSNTLKKVKKDEKRNIGEYTGLYPLPQWCKWTATKCNTHCGFFVHGQCEWDRVDEVPDLTNATITNSRDWYLKQINQFKKEN